MDALPDDVLMARVQTGDGTAFEHLLERHLPAIHAYAYRLTRSHTDADDLAQETFLRLWQKASSYRPGTVRLTTWLHRVAHNTFVDTWRKREDTLPLDDEGDMPATPAESRDDARMQAVQRGLMQLPLNQRTAVSLCLLGRFSAEEAGQIMGMSTDAVESLIARARRTLRTLLADGREHT